MEAIIPSYGNIFCRLSSKNSPLPEIANCIFILFLKTTCRLYVGYMFSKHITQRNPSVHRTHATLGYKVTCFCVPLSQAVISRGAIDNF